MTMNAKLVDFQCMRSHSMWNSAVFNSFHFVVSQTQLYDTLSKLISCNSYFHFMFKSFEVLTHLKPWFISWQPFQVIHDLTLFCLLKKRTIMWLSRTKCCVLICWPTCSMKLAGKQAIIDGINYCFGLTMTHDKITQFLSTTEKQQ